MAGKWLANEGKQRLGKDCRWLSDDWRCSHFIAQESHCEFNFHRIHSTKEIKQWHPLPSGNDWNDDMQSTGRGSTQLNRSLNRWQQRYQDCCHLVPETARLLQISTWHRELGHKEWQIAAIEGWQERAAQMHHGLLSHTLWMAMLHWKRNSLVGWPSVDHRLTIGWPSHRLTIGWPSVDQIANSFGQLSCWRLAWKQLQVDFAPVMLRRSVKGEVNLCQHHTWYTWYTVIYLTWKVTMQLVRLVTSYSRVRRSRRSWLHNAAMQYRHTSASSRQAISQCGKLWQRVQGLGAVCQ